jgi:predicted nuclease of predicted toxin-antitoxin system
LRASSKPRREPPKFLTDRCLGLGLAESIRTRGYEARTLRDIYGEQRASTIPDHEWIEDGAQAGYILLTKDYAIRRLLMIADALKGTDARLFCLTNAHLSGREISERFLFNLNRIIQRSIHRGPYIYAVLTKSVELRWPAPSESLAR